MPASLFINSFLILLTPVHSPQWELISLSTLFPSCLLIQKQIQMTNHLHPTSKCLLCNILRYFYPQLERTSLPTHISKGQVCVCLVAFPRLWLTRLGKSEILYLTITVAAAISVLSPNPNIITIWNYCPVTYPDISQGNLLQNRLIWTSSPSS